MVIMNLKLNNILSFFDFEINFSYPKKLTVSTIENECLEHIPTFRYKKLNIFMGANASGKTTLMTCIWKTLLFLARKEKTPITQIINYNYENSYIEIDLAIDDETNSRLHRIKIMTYNNLQETKINVSHNYVSLNSTSSYENKLKELNALEDNYIDYIECLNKMNISFGWNVILPATEPNFDVINFIPRESEAEENEYLHILNQVLKTFDPSITNVFRSQDANNAFVIEHENTQKIIVQEGNKMSSILILSSGTKYGFNIANMLFSIKHNRNNIYIIDEQFSYVNSDVEAAILSTMVSLLGPNEQMFFTTHNPKISSLSFPFHSFNFMKKEYKDGKYYITTSCASEVENKNNVSPKTILDNDVFATAPNVNKIFELGENDE